MRRLTKKYFLRIFLSTISATFILLGSILLGVGMAGTVNTQISDKSTGEIARDTKTSIREIISTNGTPHWATNTYVGEWTGQTHSEIKIRSLFDSELKKYVNNYDDIAYLIHGITGTNLEVKSNIQSRYNAALAGFAFFIVSIPVLAATIYVFVKKK